MRWGAAQKKVLVPFARQWRCRDIETVKIRGNAGGVILSDPRRLLNGRRHTANIIDEAQSSSELTWPNRIKYLSKSVRLGSLLFRSKAEKLAIN